MKRRNLLVAVAVIIALLASSLFLTSQNFFLPNTEDPSSEYYMGVQLGYGNFTDCQILVDKVKNYTNLFVISAGTITRSEAVLNECCDYVYENGLSFFIFFSDLYSGTSYSPLVWLVKAREKYGDQFLGIYFSDEPGGKQLDGASTRSVTGASDYQAAAAQFMQNMNANSNGKLSEFAYLCNYSGSSVLTSDYGLYWFDYAAGYDVVLTQFGWNNSRPLQVALCRGAANVQGKDWGTIITWEYTNFPYIESGEELYDDMVFSYKSGAKYTVVFNYAGDNTPNPYDYGILTEEHFGAIKNFWNYIHTNPQDYSVFKADVAYVLPQCYGFGFRSADDVVWGFKEPDCWAGKVFEDTHNILNQYGSRLDLVYNDPEFNDAIESKYDTVLSWSSGAENANCPVLNLNTTMGFTSIQEAISSRTTFSGSTILVKSGTYHENLYVTKPLTLIGEDKQTTIIDGGNNGSTITISSTALGTNLTGFTIRGGGGIAPANSSGLCLSIAANCTITDNIVTANKFGITLLLSLNNTFRNNQILDNDYNFGIADPEALLNSLSYSSFNIVQLSSLYGNLFDNNIDTSNTVNGKPIIYWINKTDQVVPSNAGYVALINCKGVTVQDLSLSNNANGLFLAYTSGLKVSNNVLNNNYEGMRMQSSQDNTLRNNTFSDYVYNFIIEDGALHDIDSSNTINNKPVCYWFNAQHKTVPENAGYVALLDCTDITVKNLNLSGSGQGILLVNTTDSTVASNSLSSNFYGIVLENSSGNTISANNVTDNLYGILLSNSSSTNTLNKNRVTDNQFEGITLSESRENVVSENYLASNQGGISIGPFANYTTVTQNDISANSYFGIHLEGSSHNRLVGNNVTGNGLNAPQYTSGGGIFLDYYLDSLSNNYVEYNNVDNQILENNIVNNPVGITLQGSNDNTKIYHNNFNNIAQATISYSTTGTQWDDGSSGNYWSDYAGTDANHDGIGDEAYVISSSQSSYQEAQKDKFPLIQPFSK